MWNPGQPNSATLNLQARAKAQNRAFAREGYTNSTRSCWAPGLKTQKWWLCCVSKNGDAAREGDQELEKSHVIRRRRHEKRRMFQDSPEPKMKRFCRRGAQHQMEANAMRKPIIIEIASFGIHVLSCHVNWKAAFWLGGVYKTTTSLQRNNRKEKG